MEVFTPQLLCFLNLAFNLEVSIFWMICFSSVYESHLTGFSFYYTFKNNVLISWKLFFMVLWPLKYFDNLCRYLDKYFRQVFNSICSNRKCCSLIVLLHVCVLNVYKKPWYKVQIFSLKLTFKISKVKIIPLYEFRYNENLLFAKLFLTCAIWRVMEFLMNKS